MLARLGTTSATIVASIQPETQTRLNPVVNLWRSRTYYVWPKGIDNITIFFVSIILFIETWVFSIFFLCIQSITIILNLLQNVLHFLFLSGAAAISTGWSVEGTGAAVCAGRGTCGADRRVYIYIYISTALCTTWIGRQVVLFLYCTLTAMFCVFLRSKGRLDSRYRQ